MSSPSCLRQAASAGASCPSCVYLLHAWCFFVFVPLQEKPYISARYAKLWYKRSYTVGIRRKFDDNKQIWSFGGFKCGFTKDVLMQWGEKCLKHFDAGGTEEEVKAGVDRLCPPKD